MKPKVLLFALFALISTNLRAQLTQPNIVFIITDDQRPDTIQMLGDFFAKNGLVDIQTPNLDGLVASGCTFTNARNMGSSQDAVCIASRSMIMSGQTLWRKNNALSGRTTLGEILQSAGYYTFGCGKWHNSNAHIRTFDRARSITPGHLPNGNANNFTMQNSENGVAQPNTNNASGEHSSNIIGQEAVNFIQNHGGAKPFFAYVSFNGPHDPFDPFTDSIFPGSDRAPYEDATNQSTLSLPVNWATDHAFDPGVLNVRDELIQQTETSGTLPARPLDVTHINNQNADYAAMITRIDYWVGQIKNAVEGNPMLTNDTIYIFTSDHGLARGSHGLLGKQNMYEHSLEIPLIIVGPGIPANSSNDGLCYTHDLFTTVADFAGAALPASHQVEGLSVRPMAEGKIDKVRSVAYHGYDDVMRSVRQNDWKLIEYHVNGTTRHTQLFDLSVDPYEQNDLSANPVYATRLAELRTLLVQQKNYYGDSDGNFWNNSGLLGNAGHADITWNPATAQETTSKADLIPGNVVFARNGGSNSVTVDGISFPAFTLGGIIDNAYDTAIASTGDTHFDGLIESFSYGGGTSPDITITGLADGETYTVQVFFNDQRASFTSRVMGFGDGNGNNINVAASHVAGAQTDDYGQHAIGMFTAEGTTQRLRLLPQGFSNAHITAVLVTGPAAPPVDSDGDGETDEVEMAAGTDPYDPESRTVFILASEGKFTWVGRPGFTYQIIQSPELNPVDWTDFGSAVAGAGTLIEFDLTPAPTGLRYFRLRINPSS